jgi:hypothetical protein
MPRWTAYELQAFELPKQEEGANHAPSPISGAALVFLVFIRSIRHGFRDGFGIRRFHGLRSPEIGRDRSYLLGCVA